MNRKFWAKVWLAIEKLIAFYIFIVLHYGAEIAFNEFIMGFVPNMPFWRDLYHVITFAAFSIVYLHLLWEMVAVFVPWIAGRPESE